MPAGPGHSPALLSNVRCFAHHVGGVLVLSTEAGIGYGLLSRGEYDGAFSLQFTYFACLKMICIIDKQGEICFLLKL